MTSNKVYSMFGLAQRAGKLVSGDDICEMTIKTNKCCLVIVSQDASDRTKKKFKDMCSHRNIKLLEYGEKERIGDHIGKESRSVIAIKDENFARKIEELIIEKMKQSGGEPIA